MTTDKDITNAVDKFAAAVSAYLTTEGLIENLKASKNELVSFIQNAGYRYVKASSDEALAKAVETKSMSFEARHQQTVKVFQEQNERFEKLEERLEFLSNSLDENTAQIEKQIGRVDSLNKRLDVYSNNMTEAWNRLALLDEKAKSHEERIVELELPAPFYNKVPIEKPAPKSKEMVCSNIDNLRQLSDVMRDMKFLIEKGFFTSEHAGDIIDTREFKNFDFEFKKLADNIKKLDDKIADEANAAASKKLGDPGF